MEKRYRQVMAALGRRRAAYLQSRWRIAVLVLLCAMMSGAVSSDMGPPDRERRSLLSSIQTTAITLGRRTGIYMFDTRVLHAMSRVPRRQYVPVEYANLAYFNVALPLSGDYTIPEPYMTALTMHLLDIDPDDKVFEAGLDGGYNTAVLAELAQDVYLKPGVTDALPDYARAGYDNVHVLGGDGYYGWKEKGPFDAILVNQGLEYPPWRLIAQLAPGGRLVAPVGRRYLSQYLTLYVMGEDRRVTAFPIMRVSVPPLFNGIHI